jgi:ribA/ribD-fused uncharacterized protein
MGNEIVNIESLLKETRSGKRFKYIFFWGHRARKNGQIGKQCFSQWWGSSFEIDGIRYPSAEVYMMAEKARLFNDDRMLNKILSCSNPGAAKKYGREIRNFNEDVWNKNRFDIVVRGNKSKFEQNEELKQFLLNTKDRIIVEASPVDKIWGIGLAKDDKHAENPEKWKGLNLLGFALMKVRSLLQKQLSPNPNNCVQTAKSYHTNGETCTTAICCKDRSCQDCRRS